MSSSDSAAVPFSLKLSKYSKLEGLLHAQPDGLLIEFYHKRSYLKIFGTRLKEKKIDAVQIVKVGHNMGWFRDTLHFRFQSMEAAEGIPGSTMGEWTVHLKKKDRARAEAFVVDLQLAIADKRLENIESRRA